MGVRKIKKILFNKEIEDEIIRLHNENIGARKIKEILSLNCSESVIWRMFKEKNITPLSSYRKYFFNEDFFETIDTEEKAYWLGFLYADGNVNKNTLGINLSSKDKNILERFNKVVRGNRPIEEGMQNSFGTEVPYARIFFHSKKMVNDLINKGCFYKKSLILKFPTEEQVPIIFQKDFIRGYFDGDGGFTIDKKHNIHTMNFQGTFEFLEGVRDFFQCKNPIVHDKRHLDKNIYSIHIGGNLNVITKGNMIYENATVFLERKYEIFKKLKDSYSEELIKERSKYSSLLRQ